MSAAIMNLRAYVLRLCTISIIGIGLMGCSAYDTHYKYEPHPADVPVSVNGHSGPAVKALVTVMGLRRENKKLNIPTSVHVGLRFENVSDQAVRFDPSSLVLVAADLDQFPSPTTIPSDPVEVEPGKVGQVEAYFPFPGGKYPGGFDLSGLNLRWTLEVGGQAVPGSATFSIRRLDHYQTHPGVYGGGIFDGNGGTGVGVGVGF